MGDDSERVLWSIVDAAGHWWWWSIAALAAANLFMMYRLAAPSSMYSRILRTIAFAGFMLIALSPRNSAFGPYGLPLVLMAFLGVHHQMFRACRAQGKTRHPEMTWFRRIMAAMVEPKNGAAGGAAD